MRKRHSRVLPALFLALSGTAIGDDWFVYTSDNFTVYSDASRGDAVRVLENFEVFRRVVMATLGLPNVQEDENLRIVVFQRPRDFDRFKPNDDTGGFFYHSVFGPRMMVGPSWSATYTQRILFHEYVHYLMDQHSVVNYPRWYAEGLAGVLEMTEIRSASAVAGHVLPPTNSPMPVSEVIDLEFDAMDAGFYYTSWLLTHYLMIDSVDDPERRRRTREYLVRYDAGEDPVAAFVDSIGLSIDEMQRQINSYAGRSRFTVIEFPEVLYEGALAQEPLSIADELYLLGDLAVELGKRSAAFDYFEQFDDLEGTPPLTDKVNSRRAIAFVHDDKIAEGDALIAALVAADPADTDIQTDIAHYAYDRYVYAREHEETDPGRHLDQAIAFGARAMAGNPADLEALFYLGLAYERRGELQPAADTLLKFYDANPSVTVLNMNLARVLIKGNQKDLGLYLIARAYSSAHAQAERDEIRRIQQIIEADDFDVSTIDRLL